MRKYIAAVVLILFVIPSIVHAVWWNPFSWFKKSVTPPKVLQVGVTKPIVKVLMATTTPVSTTTPSARKGVSITHNRSFDEKYTDQSTEIEKLKKEVEELKKSQTRIAEPAESQKPIVLPEQTPLTEWQKQEIMDEQKRTKTAQWEQTTTLYF